MIQELANFPSWVKVLILLNIIVIGIQLVNFLTQLVKIHTMVTANKNIVKNNYAAEEARKRVLHKR